ncbi:MAG: cephalosporin hydroxylase family protein [Candidatus Baltobacteraceae bacterium]
MSIRDSHDPYDSAAIAAMRADTQFGDAARVFLEKTFEYGYYRNFTWLGRPVIQYPQDVVALQELIWSYKPTLVVETGVAHGGALILYASIMELIGGKGEVLGIEIEYREHNKAAIAEHPLARRIEVIEGSSIAPEVLASVRKRAAAHERIMVVLDSYHTHEHVLEELKLYSPLVRKGGPLIVFGTSVATLGASADIHRPWNQERNPKSALDEFLKQNGRFTVNRELNDKLLLTDAPDGYLVCTEDP